MQEITLPKTHENDYISQKFQKWRWQISQKWCEKNFSLFILDATNKALIFQEKITGGKAYKCHDKLSWKGSNAGYYKNISNNKSILCFENNRKNEHRANELCCNQLIPLSFFYVANPNTVNENL